MQKRRCFNIVLCFGFAMLLVILFQVPYVPIRMYRLFYPRDSIVCYRIQTESLPEVTNISIRKGKSIFFHETSCKSFYNDKISISSRQACAVESAARTNPNYDVYLLFTSPGIFKFEGDESDNILKGLLSYKNIKIMHLDYEKYTKGSPVEDLFSSGKIEDSIYAQSHASDVLR